jgi:predicted nucleic-acid-binding Zn-ribbon protein
MAQSTIACPKCKHQMQEGYLREEARLARWYEGPPKRWLGMAMVGWSTKQLPITSYRCSSCGYLESYARSYGR